MTGNASLLAPRMAGVQESPTAAISAKVRSLTAEGRSVINLGEGELDFDTPEHLQQAGVAAIRDGATRYTAVGGTAELKAAICTKFLSQNNLDYAPRQVIAATGAKQIIFNAMLATVSTGDEVIIPVPSWVSYPDIVRLCGGTAVMIDCPEAAGFKLSAAALSKAITPRSKWLILNSPNNPTGAVYSAEELRSIAEVIREHPQVMVLSDDIYEHICYEIDFQTMAAVAPELFDRTLTVNGVSKVYSMTGWRLGYAGGPAWLINAMDTLQSQSTSNACSISQAAAVVALRGPLEFFETRLSALKRRRDRVLTALAETQGRLTALRPQGAFYVFADCEGMIGAQGPDSGKIENDVDAAAYLLDEAGLAMVPGAAFGMSPYLRIAFAIDDGLLEEACWRLIEACRRLA